MFYINFICYQWRENKFFVWSRFSRSFETELNYFKIENCYISYIYYSTRKHLYSETFFNLSLVFQKLFFLQDFLIFKNLILEKYKILEQTRNKTNIPPPLFFFFSESLFQIHNLFFQQNNNRYEILWFLTR